MSQKRILAFGASSSSTSINKQLAYWAAEQIDNVELDLLDLREFEMPVFSVDKENENGIHPLAKDFKARLEGADGVIISFAEHNGAYSSAFKNVYDWMSRLGAPIWCDKPMLFLATSPGGRGGASVLELALNNLPRRGVQVIADFSLPFFNENFNAEKGITNPELFNSFRSALSKFEAVVK